MDLPAFLARELGANLEFMKATIGDFSDADLFVRPCPNANHAAWQLGHLIVAETSMIAAQNPPQKIELPAGFAEKFKKDTAGIDDPKAFGVTKEELLKRLSDTRAATIAWVKSLTPADMDKPTQGRAAGFAPTWGQLAQGMCGHILMHLGQLQVIRRKLGKPVMF